MAQLLDLPDEILLKVISNLAAHHQPDSLDHVPFYHWVETLMQQDEQAQEQITWLRPVSASRRRLYDVCIGALYSYIPLVGRPGRPSSDAPSMRLLRALGNDQSPLAHVRCLHIDVKSYSAPGFYKAFWLPSVRIVSLRRFVNREALEWDGHDHVGTSPVEVLRLIGCGAHEEALAEVLSWPKALKELWYDIDQAYWDGLYWNGHSPGPESHEFTCGAAERAMKSQANSLERLRLHQIEASIYHIFLVGRYSEDEELLWDQLPRSLNELEVFFDDDGVYLDFLEGPTSPDQQVWLRGFLESIKRSKNTDSGTPESSLERLRIVSMERPSFWYPDPPLDGGDEGEHGNESEPDFVYDVTRGTGHPESAWKPPLTRSFIEAGVGFSVFLRQKRRYSPPSPHSSLMAYEFDNILNFRDVGRTANDFVGRRLVKEGVLYRSARPDDASPRDRETLKNGLGIKTVMDLRTKTEHLKQAEKRRAAADADPETIPARRIPGVRYSEIRITGRQFELFLLSHLSWLGFFQFIFLYILGYRVQAISIIGREVMLPRGLVGLGLDTLDQSGREIAEALRVYAEPGSLPLLVHCTQGKDRTGLVVALVLMILGVPTEAINHDYLLSRDGLRSEKEARMAEIKEIGLTPEWGDTPKDFVARLEQHVATRYNGVNGYLDEIGFGNAERKRLIDGLRA
ncbi:hypothetical protein DL766_007655 [Monosporascus sp. MC13-8B]|nr:hypothetical protein DL763_007479 [Monosporascus cannonballus]RYP22731.1 hypothetical protein DL766_007655 [Monosporascus sp. MC13-8B]